MKNNSLSSSEIYQHFIEELKAIICEGVYDSNMRLIETYHEFGMRILQETESFGRAKIYGEEITKRVALDIGKSQRTVQKCVQFASKYPNLQNFLASVPEGKAISWNKISNTYIVEAKPLVSNAIVVMNVSNIKEGILKNLDFLVETAEITNDGIHLFIPKDRA